MKPLKQLKNVSKSNAAAGSSGNSLVSPLSGRSLEQQIDLFVESLQRGMLSLREAGQVLVTLLERDRDVFEKITERCSWLTNSNLWALYHVGSGRHRPEVLLIGGTAAEHLMRLPYDEQCRVLDNGVKVVTGISKERPVVETKQLKDLTVNECKQLFNHNQLRTVPQQKTFLEDQQMNRPAPPRRPPTPATFWEQDQKENQMLVNLAKPTPTRPQVGVGTYKITMVNGYPTMKKLSSVAPHPDAQKVLLTWDDTNQVMVGEVEFRQDQM